MTAVAERPTAGFAQVVRSEWTKLRSVRSTPWSLVALVVVSIGFAALASWGTGENLDQLSARDRAVFDPTSASLSGLALGQLAIGVLGVLVMTSEYTTGGIRTSLVAVPRRSRLVLAKALVVAAVALVVGTASAFGAFLVGQAVLAHYDLSTSLGDPGVLRAVVGGGLYLMVTGLFGFAVGTVLRQSASSIVAVVALLLVVPPLTGLLPGSWGDTVTKYFLSNAGQQVVNARALDDRVLRPWPGFLAFLVEALVVLALGVLLVRRRDA